MYKRKVSIIILIFSIFITSFAIYGCNQKSDTTVYNNDKKYLELLTPAQITQLYVNSLIKGDASTINSLLSKKYLKEFNKGKGYASVAPQSISGVKIKISDSKISENRNQYILEFNLDKINKPSPFDATGPGPHYYFINFVKEDNIWKIDSIATTP